MGSGPTEDKGHRLLLWTAPGRARAGRQLRCPGALGGAWGCSSLPVGLWHLTHRAGDEFRAKPMETGEGLPMAVQGVSQSNDEQKRPFETSTRTAT